MLESTLDTCVLAIGPLKILPSLSREDYKSGLQNALILHL